MQSRLGRYVVLKHLASGGMADVLLGRTDGIEGFERHVVLKRIRPEHAKDQRFIRMFLDEARVAANLHHQHIVQVHDIGEAEGEYFIAMEFLHGEDVRTVLSTASKMRQHVPLGCAMAMVSCAASGLHYAHERRGQDKRPLGIVHRDISPSNILVGYDGSIKIVDFGIAKASMRQETRSSTLKGKISYMSPEQCKGAEVDRRSDVYSLGVVLYELCTTTRLFKGESDYLVMDQIVNGRVTLPQVRRPELPNELSAIIMRALAPDPERRYFTADELRVALDQFAAKAGLTASTSAIASYVRKQFGEKPEPWLELEGRDFDLAEDVPSLGAPATDSAPGKSWTDLPNSEEFRRSTGSITRNSGPISVVSTTSRSEHTSRSSVARIPSTMPPTDSKMGWESQQPAQPARTLTPAAKIVMISAPLILLLGIAIWRLAGTGSSGSPVAATIGPPALQPPAATAPVVTPIEPPRPPPPPAAGSASLAATLPPPAAATSAKAGPPTKHTAATTTTTTAATKKASVAKVAEAAPSAPATTVKVDPPPPAPSPSPTLAPPATPGAPLAQGSGAITTPAATPPTVVAALPPPPPPPAPPPPPQTVAQNVLDANRISGDKEIVPDDTTQTEIGRSNVDSVNGLFKVCLTPEGTISGVTALRSTGFPAYDNKIQNTIRRSWRYRPFLVAGKAAAVCTAVRFLYTQK